MNESTPPKRSFTLILSFVLVVATCVFVTSMAIAMFGSAWDPCSLIGGIMLLPFSLTLGVQQYRAVIHAQSKASASSAVLLFIVGGIALLTFAMILAEGLAKSFRLPWFSLLFPMLAIGLAASLAGWFNLQWSRQLKRRGFLPLANPRVSSRDCLAGLVAIACTTVLVARFVQSMSPQFAENVERNKVPFELPSDASSVSYCRGYRGTVAYEFTVDEEAFVKWVDSGIGSLESTAADISLQPIASPYTIRRYSALTDALAGPDSVTITNGFYYAWSKEDRGVYAAFDRDNNRAYYFAHFH